ncbi:MAG: beta-propeller domain-containing protein [Tissierellia bacterium]|nr:beta-propeller domain-containing protein [Tissierellia bacterium]
MMKKTYKIILLTLILILCFTVTAFAQDDIKVYVDNERVDFDVAPFVEKGRTLIPLRGVFEKLGAKVDWNKNLLEVVIKDDNNEIEMILGKDKVMVNGIIKDIDVPTRMINSRTFAPLRFATENLGHTVRWDGNTRSVYITKNDTFPVEKIISTVGTKENLIALLEYNSKLNNYIWMGRTPVVGIAEDSVAEAPQAPKAEAESPVSDMDSSDTNVQVEGVQEGDIIKNDGKYIYINTSRGLKTIDSNPVAPKIVNTIPVPENTGISEIFTAGNKLIVIGQNNYYHIMNEVEAMDTSIKPSIMPSRYYEDRTNVLIYNIENIEKPVLEREYLFDGNYLSGRVIDDSFYLVNNKYLNLGYRYYDNKDIDIPLPYYTDVLNYEDYEFGYDEIKYFPNYINTRYMYIIGIDLKDTLSKPDVDVYLGGTDTIYVSKENLYAAVADYSYDYEIRQLEEFRPEYTTSTVIYKFGLKDGKIGTAVQGEVPGTIINQFSMDEHNNNFRIATTTDDMWSGKSKNNVYILDESLKALGKLEGLAEGERIYSTRFAGDRMYMVTFRQVDPLFVIDTSNPRAPELKGMLKIPGYSTYLHMVDENHILGFGYDTEENQWGGTVNGGLKISMFDVSNVNKPKETFTEIIGKSGSYSELLYNHKALMFSLNKGLMAFPVNRASENYKSDFSGAYVYNVSNDSISLRNIITHKETESQSYGDNIKRIIYIGDYLYTFSENEMQVHNISTNKKVNELLIK